MRDGPLRAPHVGQQGVEGIKRSRGEGSTATEKARAASRLRPLNGEGRNSSTHCVRDGYRFESPLLHQEVGANRRDFLVRRIARHSRGLWRQFSLIASRGLPGFLSALLARVGIIVRA